MFKKFLVCLVVSSVFFNIVSLDVDASKSGMILPSSKITLVKSKEKNPKAIKVKSNWKYYEYSKINDGVAYLYKSTSNSRKNRTICINAGHGSKDSEAVKTLCHPDSTPKLVSGSTQAGSVEAPGMTSGMIFKDGTLERDATLKTALKIKEILLNNGYNVLMIRESDDVRLDNIARTLIANNKADCHISIHYDGDGLSYDKGVFFCSVPDIDSYRNMEPVKSNWRAHNKLGECLVDGMVSQGLTKFNNGAMPMDLVQTSFSTVPSVDIEVGNACSLLSNDRLEKIGNGISSGLDVFFGL